MFRALPLIALLASPLALAQDSGRRVVVVPFAPLTGDVPVRSGAKAAGMLETELKNAQGVSLIASEQGTGILPAQAALSEARGLVETATKSRSGKRFGEAEQTLTKALASYAAAAPALEDVAEVADAWNLLAAVQYQTGKDEAAKASLAQALALAPNRQFPLAATSPRFARVVESQRQAVAAAGKGSLTVESIPSGAQVSVDGNVYGTTPLELKEVPAGKHLWRVRLPTGEEVGGQVEIAAGKQAKVQGATTITDASSRLISALAQNKLDASTVAAAKEYGAAQKADAVFFGGLSRDGKALAWDGFVLDVKAGSVQRLPRTTFDEDLLSAGQQFLQLASAYGAGKAPGEVAKVPGAVAPGRLAAARTTQATFTQASAKASPSILELVEEPKKDAATPAKGPRTPLKRTPLKKN